MSKVPNYFEHYRDIDILKMYLQTENEAATSSHSKGIA